MRKQQMRSPICGGADACHLWTYRNAKVVRKKKVFVSNITSIPLITECLSHTFLESRTSYTHIVFIL